MYGETLREVNSNKVYALEEALRSSVAGASSQQPFLESFRQEEYQHSSANQAQQAEDSRIQRVEEEDSWGNLQTQDFERPTQEFERPTQEFERQRHQQQEQEDQPEHQQEHQQQEQEHQQEYQPEHHQEHQQQEQEKQEHQQEHQQEEDSGFNHSADEHDERELQGKGGTVSEGVQEERIPSSTPAQTEDMDDLYGDMDDTEAFAGGDGEDSVEVAGGDEETVVEQDVTNVREDGGDVGDQGQGEDQQGDSNVKDDPMEEVQEEEEQEVEEKKPLIEEKPPVEEKPPAEEKPPVRVTRSTRSRKCKK